MKLHVLVEGPSEVSFLDAWLPRLLKGHTCQVYRHQGKGTLPRPDEAVDPRRRGLLDQLPGKLTAFGESLDPATDAVVVLVDADDSSCVELLAGLKATLDRIQRSPRVLFRIAIEELEAFYLGDQAALARAYPDYDGPLVSKYVPDSICGTAELFDKAIRGMGGMNKVSWGEEMGSRLTTSAARNRSPSFKKFVTGLLALVDSPPPAKVVTRPYRHPPKPKKNSTRKR